MSYEMANSDSPEEIAKAVQRALISAIKDVLIDLRKTGDLKNQPGLTWDQIDFVLTQFSQKAPKIVHQKRPM